MILSDIKDDDLINNADLTKANLSGPYPYGANLQDGRQSNFITTIYLHTSHNMILPIPK